MFYECSSLLSIPDLSKWKPINIIMVNHMFYGCSSLITMPDISKWKINNEDFSLISNNFSSSSSIFSGSSDNNLISSFKSDNNINKYEKVGFEDFNIFEKIENEELNNYYDNFYY